MGCLLRRGAACYARAADGYFAARLQEHGRRASGGNRVGVNRRERVVENGECHRGAVEIDGCIFAKSVRPSGGGDVYGGGRVGAAEAARGTHLAGECGETSRINRQPRGERARRRSCRSGWRGLEQERAAGAGAGVAASGNRQVRTVDVRAGSSEAVGSLNRYRRGRILSSCIRPDLQN